MNNSARCPHCDARTDEQEQACPRCGRALADHDVTTLGFGGTLEPLQLDDAPPTDGAPARTSFGIHVLDVGAPPAGAGAARATAADADVPIDTLVGRRAPGGPAVPIESGLGVPSMGTAVGVRVPIAPRDAESTQLNALGNADRLAEGVETMVIATRRPDQTSVGLSLEDVELPSTPRPQPAKLADDWLDDISDYLRDLDPAQTQESARTPAPAEDEPPAFGILKRSAKRAAAPELSPSLVPAPQLPDTASDTPPAPESQIARIQTQSVHPDDVRVPDPPPIEAPVEDDAPPIEAPVEDDARVSERVPPPRFGAALDGPSVPIGAPLPPSGSLPTVDREAAPKLDSAEPAFASDADAEMAFGDTLAASDADHGQALADLLREPSSGSSERTGSGASSAARAVTSSRGTTTRSGAPAAASRGAADDPTEKKLRAMTFVLLGILVALIGWIALRS